LNAYGQNGSKDISLVYLLLVGIKLALWGSAGVTSYNQLLLLNSVIKNGLISRGCNCSAMRQPLTLVINNDTVPQIKNLPSAHRVGIRRFTQDV